MSPEQVQAALGTARSRLDTHGGVLEQLANLVSSPISTQNSRDFDQYKADKALTDDADNGDLKKALEEAMSSAIKKNANVFAGGQAAGGVPGGAARDQSIVQRN